MHKLKLLLLAAALSCASAFATDYSVVGYGGAACNGSTDDTAAFNSTYAQVMATGGGRVLVPSGAICRVENFFLDATTAAESARPIDLAADGGGHATLKCLTCQAIVTIGSTTGNYWFNFHKSITNIDFDLSSTNQSSITGIYARDVLDMRLDHVRIYNSNSAITNARGIFIYSHGLHNCYSPLTTCHSSGNVLLQPYINGYFYNGIQLDGEDTNSNGGTNQTMIIGAQVLRPYTDTGVSCHNVPTGTTGISHTYSDSLTILTSNVEGFDHGMDLEGLNARVFGGRTECNNVGVWINEAIYPNQYHAAIIGSQHSDGKNFNGSNRVSVVESYFGTYLVTNLESTRQVRQSTTHCTTGTSLWNTCYASIAISPAFVDTSYSVNCTPRAVSGAVAIYDVSKTSGSSFNVSLINLSAYGTASAAKLDCLIVHDNSLGATTTP